MTTWLHPHGAMITPNEDGHHFCPSPVFRWGIRNPPSTQYLELGGWKKVRQRPLNMKGTKNPHRLLAKTNSNILIRLQLFSDAYLNISQGKSPKKNTKWPGTFFLHFSLGNPAALPPEKHVRHSICPRTWKATPWGKRQIRRISGCEGNNLREEIDVSYLSLLFGGR